jgi:hypothetical protein
MANHCERSVHSDTRLLLVDALHPDEIGAGEAKAHYEQHPRQGLAVVIGNTAAYTAGVQHNGRRPRFLERNMNHSFGRDDSDSIEAWQANALGPVLAASELVVDVHFSESPGPLYRDGSREHVGYTAFFNANATPAVLNAAAFFGVRKALCAWQGSLSSAHPNAIAVEFPTGDIASTIATLDALADAFFAASLPDTRKQIEMYELVDTPMPAIDAQRLKLPDHLHDFDELPQAAADHLGMPEQRSAHKLPMLKTWRNRLPN